MEPEEREHEELIAWAWGWYHSDIMSTGLISKWYHEHEGDTTLRSWVWGWLRSEYWGKYLSDVLDNAHPQICYFLVISLYYKNSLKVFFVDKKLPTRALLPYTLALSKMCITWWPVLRTCCYFNHANSSRRNTQSTWMHVTYLACK